MVTSAAGPLRNLGAAAWWCLTAGMVEPNISAPHVEAFEEECELILREGLAPVALRAFGSGRAWKKYPVATLFHQVTVTSQLRSMAVDIKGAALLSRFDEVGLPAAVIKGPAVARLHPSGWPRTYSDIDLVVSKQSFSRAVACSITEGFAYSERTAPPWHWFYRFCREGLNLHSDSGGNIDIHHHIPPWVLGARLTTQDVIERSAPSSFSGVPVRFASTEDLLIVSMLHVLNDLWKGKLGLASWRDVIVVARVLGPSGSAKAVEDAGLEWLFDLVTEALHLALPEIGSFGFPKRAHLRTRTRWRLAALGWGHDSNVSRHRLSWATRLPVPNALAYLAGTAFPAPKYVRTHHGSLRNYWKSGWEETVSTVHGDDYRMK